MSREITCRLNQLMMKLKKDGWGGLVMYVGCNKSTKRVYKTRATGKRDLEKT